MLELKEKLEEKNEELRSVKEESSRRVQSLLAKNGQLSNKLKRFERQSSVKEIIASYDKEAKQVEHEMEEMRKEIIRVISSKEFLTSEKSAQLTSLKRIVLKQEQEMKRKDEALFSLKNRDREYMIAKKSHRELEKEHVKVQELLQKHEQQLQSNQSTL